jgi:hypothetical protein
MSKKKILLILAGSIAGGIIYSLLASFFDYFAPITGMIAGFSGCICLIASIGRKKEYPNKYIPMFMGLSILSLLFGYVSLYYIKAEIVHGTPFHPVDIMTFKEFITITLGLPDMLSAILGGLIAYGLSDKIATSIKGIFSSRTPDD